MYFPLEVSLEDLTVTVAKVHLVCFEGGWIFYFVHSTMILPGANITTAEVAGYCKI